MGNISLFHLIAPVYGLFFDSQSKRYSEVLDNIEMDISAYTSIIDVGCGTGALCSVLSQRGFTVTGIDPVEGMLKIARKKQVDPSVDFVQANVLSGLPFDDKAFDISIASYVAHGLKGHERKALYAEMKRVAKHLVIIYDYNENRSVLTDMIEWLERGDYFNFIRNVEVELGNHFQDVRVLTVGSQASWYVCKSEA